MLIIPRRPGPGAVLELKVIDADAGETPEQAVESAFEQVEAKDYASEVTAAEADPVRRKTVPPWGRLLDAHGQAAF